MTIVVDASVLIKIVTDEPGSDAAAARVFREDDRIAPDWIRIEIAAGLLKKVRMDGLPIDQAQAGIESVDVFLTGLADTDGLTARALSMSFVLRHALYDCLYLALAEHVGCVLVTADAKFVGKALEHGLAAHIELLA